MISVYQVRLKVFTKEGIAQENAQQAIRHFLDSSLNKDAHWRAFHQAQDYKLYCFDALFPIEASKHYQAHQIYTLTVRTVDHALADYLLHTLAKNETEQFKGLVTEIQVLPYRPIEKLYTITPVIVKTPEGYWRNVLSLEDYETRLFVNLVKKYRQFTNQQIDEDFEWCRMISFVNEKPIAVKEKNIRLLGDKLDIYIAENSSSQALAHFALGVGLGEMNSRGMGFCNVKWY